MGREDSDPTESRTGREIRQMEAQHHNPTVVYKRRGFLSTLALGATVVAVTVIVSGATVLMFGMRIVDEKSDDVVELLENIVREVPQLRESLPPVLVDCINDRRMPEYVRDLNISLEMVPMTDGTGRVRPTIEVTNKGNEMVSLLTLRVVAARDGDVIHEWNEWVATPIATEGGWRGPLMPEGVRKIATIPLPPTDLLEDDAVEASLEVTDVRVWQREVTDEIREL